MRPVVNQIGSVTYRASQLVHHFLLPTLSAIDSLVLKPAELARAIPLVEVGPGAVLLSVDIDSLYTNIPHGAGLGALAWHLREVWGTRQRLLRASILGLTFRILRGNVFTFNGAAYQQLSGTAMGSPMAVCYANVYVHWVEQTYLHRDLQRNLHLYLNYRFVDDILLCVRVMETHSTSLSTRGATIKVCKLHLRNMYGVLGFD